MATYDASVKKALTASQQDLIDHKEHCSADPVKLATVGRERGHQVRIKRNDSEYGLYTVSQVRQESPDNIVRMGSAGRKRLGTSDEFAGSLDSQVPHPTFDDADAEANNEFVERLKDNGTHTGLIVIAPHGGDIEPHTDQQAERVASRLAAKGVSLWRCKGFKGEAAFGRWHITSTDIHEASFPLLNTVTSRGFSYAVAFHGFDDPEIPFDILIGGAAPYPLKQEIGTAIKGAITGSDITVHIASPDEKFGGDSLKNIVNRLTAGGANGFLDTIAPDRSDDPVLGKMGADRIDHCGLLADEQMARAVEHQAALLLGRLGLDEPHVCPGDCLANGLGVGSLKGCGRIPRSWRTTRQFTLPNRS